MELAGSHVLKHSPKVYEHGKVPSSAGRMWTREPSRLSISQTELWPSLIDFGYRNMQGGDGLVAARHLGENIYANSQT